ncbi:hypothetical protein JQ554_21900 [Bradyrhizobium diazoefficiens]|jgi:hypothetical protein|nr:hypothetical protein [Bradyrhizobium diazoefficiens]UCF52424.1 MAG: hypothetical protein JSV48_24865 [Bradyrhizobium sp.]MBR0966586.1 hypothetical protein [Bradyrhizobium diazoefficiens]MBR0980337.1 hypothetical protein [Bradyrhizobium diazoefficiens]MBR1009685.1 hypothetical protein [Bradyrhizobium diazoefficiens]MBR1016268.1 hypothetical protein [Bradyrhizobium diazoefficiens]
MVEKHITSPRNVIDLANYRQVLAGGKASSMSARMCRHCGAPLLDGENDDDCSTAISTAAPRPRERSRRIRLD